MTPAKPAPKTVFALIWGVLAWGGSTALLATLWDWRTNGDLRLGNVASRFVIFMSLGYFFGLWLWARVGAPGPTKRMTRVQIIMRTALLVGLVLFLVYVPRFFSRR